MPPLEEVLALLPPALAGLFLVVAGAWAARRGSGRAFAFAAVLGIAVAYAWTFVRLRGAPDFPPRQSSERGWFGVLGCAALALVTIIPRSPPGWRFGLHAIAGAALANLVAGGLAPEAIPSWPLALLVAGTIACFVLLDVASSGPALLFSGSVAAAAGALAQVLLLFGSALLAQLAGAIAITMGLVAVSSFFLSARFPAPATMPLAAVFAALSVDASLFMYDTPPAIALAVLAAAPIAAFGVHRAAAPRLRPWKAIAIAGVIALGVAGLGFFLAWRVAPMAGR